MIHSDLLVAAIDRALLIGPLIDPFVNGLAFRAGALLPLHIHDRLSEHAAELHDERIQSFLAYLENMNHSRRELLVAVHLGKTPSCLFPLLRVYFHRGSLSLMRYWPVDYPTVGATSSTFNPSTKNGISPRKARAFSSERFFSSKYHFTADNISEILI